MIKNDGDSPYTGFYFATLYKYDHTIARCAARGGNMTNSHYDNIGFRIVAAVEEVNDTGN
jgi:hypothetical protein